MKSVASSQGSPTIAAVKRTVPIAVASFLFLFFGLGIALAVPFNLAYIIQTGSGPVYPVIGGVMDSSTLIWMTWGQGAVIVLGVALTVTAVLGVVAGFFLWRSLLKGGIIGLILVPFDLFFAIGFGIPILYILGPVRGLLLVLGWRSLR